MTFRTMLVSWLVVLGTACGGNNAADSDGGSTANPDDPFDAVRQACVEKINALRATKSLAPYSRWTSAEACVDGEVTHDEGKHVAHDAFSTSGACGANGQGECMGTPLTAAGIQLCLTAMWGEKDQPECASCDSCAFGKDCTGCVFQSCGHYMAMSSKSFTQAACGFSTQPNAGWSAIDYR